MLSFCEFFAEFAGFTVKSACFRISATVPLLFFTTALPSTESRIIVKTRRPADETYDRCSMSNVTLRIAPSRSMPSYFSINSGAVRESSLPTIVTDRASFSICKFALNPLAWVSGVDYGFMNRVKYDKYKKEFESFIKTHPEAYKKAIEESIIEND